MLIKNAGEKLKETFRKMLKLNSNLYAYKQEYAKIKLVY